MTCRALPLLVLCLCVFTASPLHAQEEPAPTPPEEPAPTPPEEPPPTGPYDPRVTPANPAAVPTATPEPPDDGADAPEEDVAGEDVAADAPKVVEIPREDVPYFVSGARPLPATDSAVRLDLGFPDVRVAWHLPVTRTLELAPAFGVGYGLNAENAGELALLDVRCEIKWNFWSNEDLALALFADPGLTIPVWPKPGVGLVFGGPGLILDYAILEKLRLTPAIQIPWALFFLDPGRSSDFSARFPFLLRLGLEYHVSRMVNLLFHMSGGADVWTSPVVKGGNVAALLRMVFGVSIRL